MDNKSTHDIASKIAFFNKNFLIKQSSIRNPYFQLAWEEALALEMPKFGIDYGIRIWRNHKTIVLGLSEKESETISFDTLKKFQSSYKNYMEDLLKLRTLDDFTNYPFFIARRASGGGTVLQSVPENTNFSIFIDISERRDLYPIRNSYEVLLGIVRIALSDLGVESITAGKSDLSIEVLGTQGTYTLKKISGNAQFRKKNIIVQHGTLILNEKIIREIEIHQLHPPSEPDYRKRRSHNDFLTHFPSVFDEEKFAISLYRNLTNYCLNKNCYSYINNFSPQNFPKIYVNSNFLKSSLRLAYNLFREKYSKLEWILRG